MSAPDPQPAPPALVFAGTPDFAAAPLRRLLDDGYSIRAVYTQPDRPAGRGRKPRPSPVKACALEAGIPVYQPASLRDAEAQTELAALAPDLMIVVAYGLILPESVLAIPRLGCVNVHASLLPRWRGAAPIQRAILAGDQTTGITLMQMDAGLDTGPMLAHTTLDIGPEETGGSLHDRLAEAGAALLAERLPDLLAGRIQAQPQPEHGATYAEKLRKDEARLDWAAPASALERQVRAFDPWPVAQTRLDEAVIRIWAARALPADVTRARPGEVLAAGREGIDVACGEGILRLSRLQAPGGRALDAAAFLNGRPLRAGARFE